MKPILTLSLLTLLFCISLNAQYETGIRIPSKDSIELWQKQLNVPALGIGTIENGKMKEVLVYGALQEGKPATKNAVFNVASLTKSITTALTLKLVKAGKWDLDEPLFKYWVDPDVKDDPMHKKLTSRHILSHRSGFLNWRRMHETKKLTFDFEPGTKLGYSGEGFEYLKKAMENKFNTSFEILCREWVFKPAQMTNSALTWNENIDMAQVAQWHNQKGELYDFYKNPNASAADDLLTTVEDFTKFGISILDKQGLDEALFKEMITPYSAMKDKVEMGLSWVIFKDLPNGEYGLFNAGSDIGVNAIILLLPKSERGLVLMTNGDNGRNLVFKLLGQMLDAGGEMLSRL